MFVYRMFIDNAIRDTNHYITLYTENKIKDCKDLVFEKVCTIYNEFYIYTTSNYRKKNESYSNLITFIQKYYPRVKYRKLKSIATANRSILRKTLEELINIYMYEPCDMAIHKKLIKDARKFVDDRQRLNNKRQKITNF